MLSQLLRSLLVRRRKTATKGVRHQQTFRGRFEQLESRAMLSATIGPPMPLAVPSLLSASTEAAGPVGGPDFVVVPVPVSSDVDTAEIPHGDGQQYDLLGPPDMDNGLRPPQMGISIGQSSKPGEVFVQAWKLNNPTESKALVTEISGSVPTYALTQFLSFVESDFDPGMQYNWEWQHVTYDRNASRKSVQGNASTDPGQMGFDRSDMGVKSTGQGQGTDLYGTHLPLLPPELEYASMSASYGLGASAGSNSQRPSDGVYQSYSFLLAPPTLEVTQPNAIGSISKSADVPSTLDAGQGGFIRLDGSNPSDSGAASQADYDAEIAAIDAALEDLHDFYPASDGFSNPRGETISSEIAADNDAATQGGMILLQSTAPVDGNASAIASTGDAPIDWSVPDGKVQMDVTVGMYQAFDVASGELSSANTSLPAAITVPVQQRAQAARVNVSADKAVKPTKDQASAWVEMFTAAAVVGATKRKRKSRSQS